MDNPFADPSVIEAQKSAAQAPPVDDFDNPFSEEIGNLLNHFLF